MKFLSFVVSTLVHIASHVQAKEDANVHTLDSTTVEVENLFFWNRFVQETDSFSLNTKPQNPSPPLQCRVDVAIDCITPDGRDCMSIGPKRAAGTCFDGNVLDVVQFQFESRSCLESKNEQIDSVVCDDFKPFDGKPVSLECTDTVQNMMSVDPATEINESDVVTVTNTLGPLPGILVCTFHDATGAPVQRIQIDTSGTTAMVLGDKYGAATVVSCNLYSCIETLVYTYSIHNIGPIYFEISEASRACDGVPENLLSLLNASKIEVGGSISIKEERKLNVCGSVFSSTEIMVEAEAPSGGTCQIDKSYDIAFTAAPTAAPSESPTIAPVSLVLPSTTSPTPAVSSAPTTAVSSAPTSTVSSAPTTAVSSAPTATVSSAPTSTVSSAPTSTDSSAPTSTVSSAPTSTVSSAPTSTVSQAPTSTVSQAPTSTISQAPTSTVSQASTSAISQAPTPGGAQAATRGPSVETSPAPSQRPALGSTSSNTSEPTRGPSPLPSALTSEPTRYSPWPTHDSTSFPSVETMTPTAIAACNVTVDVTCITGQGKDCTSVVSTSPNMCPSQIETMRFLFSNCTCLCSNNMQGNDTVCQYTRPFHDSPVTVACTDGNLNPMKVTPSELTEGSIFDVSNPTGGSLADTLVCAFTQDGEVVQNITINTSGDNALGVLDKFGTAQVVSCDEETCLEELCYNYTITNIGKNSMNLIRADRVYNGVNESFLNVLGNLDLGSGQRVAVGECRELNVCRSVNSNTKVLVEAESPSGLICSDDLTYSFKTSSPPIPQPKTPAPVPNIVPLPPTVEPTTSSPVVETPSPTLSRNGGTFAPTNTIIGNLTIDIQCFTSDGKDCSSVGPKSPDTCNDQVDEIQFLFTNCSCQCSNNEQGDIATCEYNRQFDDTLVSISCLDSNLNALNVTPFTVMEGTLFTVENPANGSTLNTLNCTFTQDGEIVQKVAFDAPDHARLRLLDQYGAAQVVSCDEQTCLERLCFNYTIVNVGNISMQLTRADRIYEGVKDSFLNYLSTTTLNAGQSVSVGECRDLNVCGSVSSSTEIIVVADSPGGISSNQNNSYNITFLPTTMPAAPPQPVSSAPSNAPSDLCELDLIVNCKPPMDAESCELIPPLWTQCIGIPNMMEFLFTGGECGDSINVQPSIAFNCTDYGGSQPIQDGESAYIHVTDSTGDIVYFDSDVTVGSILKLNHEGSNLAASQIAKIYSDSSKKELLQEVRYHSACSGDLFLKDRLGALQLVAWHNEQQGDVTSYHDVSFDVELTVPPQISHLTVSSFQTVTNFGDFNFTDLIGRVLAAGETIHVPFDFTLDLTQRKRYTLFARLEGTMDAGGVCIGSDFISFVAGNPLPPIFPSMAPTPAPSITAEPTPNPDAIACNLASSVICERAIPGALNFPGPMLCSEIKPATQETCIASYDNEAPIQVRFLVGRGPYYYNVTDRDDDYIYVNGTYHGGEILIVDGNPPGVGAAILQGLHVKVYADNYGSPGEEEYDTYIDLQCDGEKGSLSLGNTYEDLTLIAFETRSQGVQAWYDSFAYIFSVENVGELTATLTSGIAKTIEFGTRDIVSSPINIKAGQQYEVGRFETGVIDLRSAKGQNFTAQFKVAGTGTKSGISCSNTDSIGFTI